MALVAWQALVSLSFTQREEVLVSTMLLHAKLHCFGDGEVNTAGEGRSTNLIDFLCQERTDPTQLALETLQVFLAVL